MPDVEKIIKAIEICYTEGHNCTECPFFNEDKCNDMLKRNVLELLGNKPVLARRKMLLSMWCWCCGACGVAITEGDKFCRMCGTAVKWNG